ncbi:MAG: hypothetical protein ISS87_00165 [Candidatus Pacebacteria bacterium]|nr:hypothetical protein [Candidatus Paceibacterota bacterium]
MIELIATIVFIGSFLGLFFIIKRKIPVLKEIKIQTDEQSKYKIKTQESFEKFKNILEIGFWEILLQKTISKIRIFSLKIEAKCSRLLEETREKSKRKQESEKYWNKISKISLKKKKK